MSPQQLLLLVAASRAQHRTAVTLRDLRRRLHAERRRWEWARLVRIRHYVTLDCLHDPVESSWMRTYEHGTEKNFIHLTGLSRHAFDRLLERFIPYYDMGGYSPTGGRPRKLREPHQVLGLLLRYYVASAHNADLCKEFGIPPSTFSRVLNAAEASMSAALVGFAPARIVWPSYRRQQALARLISLKQPLLKFTWGFLDGKNLKVQQPSQADLQNSQYNGWLHDVFVTGCLCFSADGLIVWAKHNCPGSWNDGDMSLDLRRLLMDANLNPDTRYGIVADSAFPCGNEMLGRIMTPLKDGDLNRLLPSVRGVASSLSAAITSIRQSAEWGMGYVEKVFHRLYLPLPYDRDKRQRRLDNLFRLSNYRVRTVGISQINTTFMYSQEDMEYSSIY